MRYGSFFRGVAEVRAWACRNSGHLHSLLRRLDGCVEMRVWALLSKTDAVSERCSDGGSTTGCGGELRVDLAPAQSFDRLTQLVRDALYGRFRECLEEIGCTGQSPMLSLYFLVERSRIACFKEAFGRVCAAEPGLMLSGPRSPYNFVRFAVPKVDEFAQLPHEAHS